ncbi:hypothetical protein BLOT_012968 [Blomia tropicalis]|nr:hypothetical protein BLOT_012968 [Blomia tropicalis]
MEEVEEEEEEEDGKVINCNYKLLSIIKLRSFFHFSVLALQDAFANFKYKVSPIEHTHTNHIRRSKILPSTPSNCSTMTTRCKDVLYIVFA